MTIIAVAGKSRAGKDEFGNVLVKKHGFTRIALADPLRELCSKVFKLDFNEFLDQDKKDSQINRIHLDFHHIDKIRDIVENEWDYKISYEARELMEEEHGAEFDTPREILRTVGMMLRLAASEDIWVELALQKIRKSTGNVVITDCRFSNEREIFSKLGAVLVLIKRNDDGNSKEHEFDLGKESDYDVVFTNDGTLTQYQSNIDTWYTIRSTELHYYQVFKYE